MKVKLDICGPMNDRRQEEIEVENWYEAEIAAEAIALSERKVVTVNHAEEASNSKGNFLKQLLGG